MSSYLNTIPMVVEKRLEREGKPYNTPHTENDMDESIHRAIRKVLH